MMIKEELKKQGLRGIKLIIISIAIKKMRESLGITPESAKEFDYIGYLEEAVDKIKHDYF